MSETKILSLRDCLVLWLGLLVLAAVSVVGVAPMMALGIAGAYVVSKVMIGVGILAGLVLLYLTVWTWRSTPAEQRCWGIAGHRRRLLFAMVVFAAFGYLISAFLLTQVSIFYTTGEPLELYVRLGWAAPHVQIALTTVASLVGAFTVIGPHPLRARGKGTQ